MNTEDLGLALAIGASCVGIGWLARGIFQEIRRRRQNNAWIRSRPYLHSSNRNHR
jgi:hypothetical protein